MRKLTMKQLRRAYVCESQGIEAREVMTNDEIEITASEENLNKYAQRFDWNWAGLMILSTRAQADYTVRLVMARKAFHKATKRQQIEYDDTTKDARLAYEEAIKPYLVKYLEDTKEALTTYERKTLSATEQFNKDRAIAFIEAYNSDEE